MVKTFWKMSFLLKMMLPKHFSALENLMPYCHEAHCLSRLRRRFNVKISRRIRERWRQYLATTKNIWYPKKPLCSVPPPSTSRQWRLLQYGGHETRRAALAAHAAEGCGHLRVAYTQTARASRGAAYAVPGSDTVFGRIDGDSPSPAAPKA